VVEEQGEHVVLRYHEIDAEAVRGLLYFLEERRARVAARELSHALWQRTLVVTVTPFQQSMSLWSLTMDEGEWPVVLRSPYAAARSPGETPSEYLRAAALEQLDSLVYASGP
jgi:hypothetical protein